MKFVIQGQEFAPADIGRLSLWDIKELQKQTGLTIKQLEADAEYLEQYDDQTDLLSDMRAVDLLGTFLWLARWTSGDRVSFEESMSVPMTEIEIVTEDDAEDPATPAEDPTVLPLHSVGAAAAPLELVDAVAAI